MEAAEEAIDPAQLLKEIQALQQEIEAYKKSQEDTKGKADELEVDLERNEKQQNELLNKIRKIEPHRALKRPLSPFWPSIYRALYRAQNRALYRAL